MRASLILGALLAVAAAAAWAVVEGGGQSGPVVTAPASFSDGESPVMYFYSDDCAHCRKQETVLAELSREGLWVRFMDVKANPEYEKKYGISALPAFLAPDGERLTGYTEKDKLRKWLFSSGADRQNRPGTGQAYETVEKPVAASAVPAVPVTVETVTQSPFERVGAYDLRKGDVPLSKVVKPSLIAVAMPAAPKEIPVEDYVMARIGDYIERNYKIDDLAGKCGGQEEIVDVLFNYLSSSGDLYKDLCGPIKEELAVCYEGSKMCNAMKGPQYAKDDYVDYCNPDREELVEKCITRYKGEAKDNLERNKDQSEIDCEREWQFNRQNMDNMCRNAENEMRHRQERRAWCDEASFIDWCKAQISSPPAMAIVQPVRTAIPCQAYPEETASRCRAAGGVTEERKDERGCIIEVACKPLVTTAPVQTVQATACPAYPQAAVDSCKSQGGNPVEVGTGGCVTGIDCMLPSTTATPVPTCVFGSRYCDGSNLLECGANGQYAAGYCEYGCEAGSCKPAPTPVQTPQPTATMEPTPPQGNFSSAGGIFGFFGQITGFLTGATSQPEYRQAPQSPEEACKMKWNDNKENFRHECEKAKANPASNCPWNICDPKAFCSHDAFVGECAKARNSNFEKGAEGVDFSRLCKLEVDFKTKNMGKFCKDKDEGYEKCRTESEDRCRRLSEQNEKCAQMIDIPNRRELLTRMVSKYCKMAPLKTKIKVEQREITDFSPSEAVPAIVATSPDISPEQEGRLRAATQKVDGYVAVGDMRLYFVTVSASGFGDLRKLPFVKDAKLDHIKRALGMPSDGRKAPSLPAGRIDSALTTLEASKQLVDPTLAPWVSAEQDRLLNVSEELSELDNESRKKDLGYSLQWFLGMQAKKEKEEAARMSAQREKLAGSISSLEQILGQVEDVAVRAKLAEQVEQLKSQRDELDRGAKGKEKSASGLFSMVAGLWGG
jgi:thiol-disulfide isomerase/thioredoxin